MNGDVLPLANAPAGDVLRVHAVRGRNGQVRRLRELGVLEGRTVRIIGNSDPLVCQIGDCRFGLCRRLARCVLVEPVPAPVAKPA